MDDDPFSGWGLRPVELADQHLLTSCFDSLSAPLSDYTFSQLYTWRNSLRILWKQMDGHLCVFANGTGDLTLLLPPIGDTNGGRALASAFELMDDYNFRHGVPDRTRVEYASEELLARFDRSRLDVRPMGADYVYDVARMIDLAGGDLASKRQAKNRFIRNYEYRAEPYAAETHRAGCLALLDQWKVHQDAQHLDESDANALKRGKESVAAALCLDSAARLGLEGLVVWVRPEQSPIAPAPAGLDASDWSIRGFTFGERLGRDQSSITIEKTDLTVKGLAQFIFSEFCRLNWSHLPLVNVGDDWGLESLRWTKMSYRPVKMMQKFVLRRERAIVSPTGFAAIAPPQAAPTPPTEVESPATEVEIRAARKADVGAALELEEETFAAFRLSKRQLHYLQQRESAVFLVAEQGARMVGQGIALVRQHKAGSSGRIYSLAVRSDCRRQKIGRRLLHSMIDELESRGVKRIYLEVEAVNVAALGLYERNGFRSIGHLPDYYGPGQHATHMMHEIPADEPANSFLFPLCRRG